MLDINHGPYLQTFFEKSSEKFDPPSRRTLDSILKLSKKSYQNMLKFRVSLDIYEANLIRVVLYSFSWVIKLVAYALVYYSICSETISKPLCYFVHFSQKFHMVFLNAVAIDLIPYSQRTIF